MAQEIKVENRIPFNELGNAIGNTNEDIVKLYKYIKR